MADIPRGMGSCRIGGGSIGVLQIVRGDIPFVRVAQAGSTKNGNKGRLGGGMGAVVRMGDLRFGHALPFAMERGVFFQRQKCQFAVVESGAVFLFQFYLGRYFCGYGVFRQIFAFDDTLFGYDRGSAFRPRFGR